MTDRTPRTAEVRGYARDDGEGGQERRASEEERRLNPRGGGHHPERDRAQDRRDALRALANPERHPQNSAITDSTIRLLVSGWVKPRLAPTNPDTTING
jgi:hypothetical protein